MFCPQCGSERPDADHFCSTCGSPLRVDVRPSQLRFPLRWEYQDVCIPLDIPWMYPPDAERYKQMVERIDQIVLTYLQRLERSAGTVAELRGLPGERVGAVS